MAATVANAEAYFATQVLHNDEWVAADPTQKQRALANAKAQLYRIYRNFNDAEKPLPDEAVFEQSLWLLRIDDTLRKAEMGVKIISVAGVQIAVDKAAQTVAPQAVLIIGRRVGRAV
ncbi:hypothetical protein SAMN05660649_04370 [Desulfotomaculum arcticum]|uniref:Uncharacterized protein n=1 Tax=Desulfotruncus arcticus DSM 17038 TaxID=1121424 RepID=A0A1I2YBM0_9FIRM|nr:hypothetical protein [Desulfotruncus arcticus]SFH23063.1 hypothetical protein SAMN05660649_04370 [Desulfotomaculum arcticum] [Desulfotruncus arcticus DSM 17038]